MKIIMMSHLVMIMMIEGARPPQKVSGSLIDHK